MPFILLEDQNEVLSLDPQNFMPLSKIDTTFDDILPADVPIEGISDDGKKVKLGKILT